MLYCLCTDTTTHRRKAVTLFTNFKVSPLFSLRMFIIFLKACTSYSHQFKMEQFLLLLLILFIITESCTIAKTVLFGKYRSGAIRDSQLKVCDGTAWSLWNFDRKPLLIKLNNTHTHARMHARTHARTHAHTHTHTHTLAYICVCVYVLDQMSPQDTTKNNY